LVRTDAHKARIRIEFNIQTGANRPLAKPRHKSNFSTFDISRCLFFIINKYIQRITQKPLPKIREFTYHKVGVVSIHENAKVPSSFFHINEMILDGIHRREFGD
jgi:hypothetical protein